MVITEEQLDEFRMRGFITFRDLLPPEDVQRLKAITSPTTWATVGVPWLDGGQIGTREITAVHFPHMILPALKSIAESSPLAAIATKLVSSHLRFEESPSELVQSMYYAKPSGAMGQCWHQDERFTPTRDASLVTAWIALDRANEQSGCLFVEPGSHRGLTLRPHTRIVSDGDVVTGEGVALPETIEPLELREGDVAFFSGFLVHGSHQNKSEDARRSLVLNYQRTALQPISGQMCSCGAAIDLHAKHASIRDVASSGLPLGVFAR
jgi:hypothetical protein